MLGHERIDTTQIYTHVHIDALREVHTRCHPHGKLGPGRDMHGKLTAPENLEGDLASHHTAEALDAASMVTACEQTPRVTAQQAVTTRPPRHEDPPDDDPPAGNAPESPSPTPKPPSSGYFLNSLSSNDSSAEAPPAETTGVSDYAYRWYDAPNARWLSEDPIGEQGGLNLYGFVLNGPVNLVDLLGLTDTGKCEVVYFVGHINELERALSNWNERSIHPSKASGNGCFTDGSNGTNGIGRNFVGNSPGGIGWASYCGGEDGNGGFNPDGGKTVKNRAIGYIKLIQNNWKATLRKADSLAADCSDCDCESIAARIVFVSDDPRYQNKAGDKFGGGSAKMALEISGLKPGMINDLKNLAIKNPPTDTPTSPLAVHFNCAKTKKSEAERAKNKLESRRRLSANKSGLNKVEIKL